MTRSLWVVAALLSIAMVGCGGAPLSVLRSRATFDLNCPRDALELLEIERGGAEYGHGAIYGVLGCGRRATYIYNGQVWVANMPLSEGELGPTTPVATPPPAEVRPAYSLPPAGTPTAQVFAAAAEAERNGRLEEAAAYYDWIARADVTNAESLARLGAVQLRLGHTEAAVTATQASLNRLPPNAPTTLVASLLVQLATAQETAGWVETARTTYERAASLDPQNAAATAGVTRTTPAPAPAPVPPIEDPTVP
jgi:tetratricopeptide (TPR) repeat protein